MTIQPLFDRDIGILSEPAVSDAVNRLILGEGYDEPIVRRLFEAYFEAAPEAEQKVIYSYIMASFVDAPPSSRRASLKTILEAMGPFGIKAGQFLNTSGLLPIEYSRDLKDFLDNVLPPDRPRVVGDLERALGTELRGIVSIGDRLGSGSVNYVQGVTAEIGGRRTEAVVRIRRDYIEGTVANENDIWRNVVEELRSSGDSREINTADIIEEARRQSMSTLAADGTELDLSIERAAFASARRTYGRRIRSEGLSGWSVTAAAPNEELQRLVEPGRQGLFSFYEKIDHTPLEDIEDEVLREALSKTIIESELRALSSTASTTRTDTPATGSSTYTTRESSGSTTPS